RAGARRIVVTDLAPFPLEMAERVGADVALNLSDDDGLRPYSKGKGTFDICFECSGAAPALAGAIGAMRPGGVIVQLGLGGDMPVPVQALTAKELALKGSFRFHAEFAVGVEMMRKGLIEVAPLITQTMPLNDAVAAFEVAGDRSRAIKAQIAFA
ncbi:MAG: zinc-binding dehydrogenase, partial [Pseudomonadota bacterium]